MNGNDHIYCPNWVLDEFKKRVERQMWQVNGIMLLNIIVMAAVVFIGVFVPRYRHHSIIGLIFQGANTLFLPIVSIVASTAMIDPDSSLSYSIKDNLITVRREAGPHNVLVSICTGLVIYVGIGTSVVIAGDSREGRDIELSKELLFKFIWVAYLMAQPLLIRTTSFTDISHMEYVILSVNLDLSVLRTIFGILVASTLCKIYQKCRVFYVARGSFLLGRNPRLIVSYMAQLDPNQDTEPVEGQAVPPPSLIVMEGGAITQDLQPRCGYSFKFGTPSPEHQQQSGRRGVMTKKGSELVTLDSVWKLDDHCFSNSTSQAKDLCFSYALIKLLRCRFAKYTISEAGFMKARNFFLHTYLQGLDYSRVFRVIEDELSFFYDYFYSSMSTPFFHRQFLLARVTNQVLSIFLCFYIFIMVMSQIQDEFGNYEQIRYSVSCKGRKGNLPDYLDEDLFPRSSEGHSELRYGKLYFDLVPVYFVLAAILISEIKETLSFVCSNLTKVVLICDYVITTRRSKFVEFVFKHLRCEWLLNNWHDKMNQCKLLVFRPWHLSVVLRRLFRLPNQKKVNVPREVKKAIFEALQRLASEQQGQALEVCMQQQFSMYISCLCHVRFIINDMYKCTFGSTFGYHGLPSPPLTLPLLRMPNRRHVMAKVQLTPYLHGTSQRACSR